MEFVRKVYVTEMASVQDNVCGTGGECGTGKGQ